MTKILNEEYEVNYKSDTETKEKLFQACLKFFIKHETFNGESICQSDGPIIDAPNFLSNLADEIFRFETHWYD